jgi:hypothetical protein
LLKLTNPEKGLFILIFRGGATHVAPPNYNTNPNFHSKGIHAKRGNAVNKSTPT